MPANRYALTVIDPSGTGGPSSNGRYPFQLAPTGKGGRSWSLQTRTWQATDPKTPWRINLHPWALGLRSDRVAQHISAYTGNLINRPPESYAAGPIDATPHGLLLPPPRLRSLTLTGSSSGPTKSVDFAGKKFILNGRYMQVFDPTTNTVSQDKDFGVGKACVDAAVFLGQLVVAMGESEKIYTRTAGGVWTQATDATYAIALGVTAGAGPSLLWRAESTNQLTNCTAAPLTLASWGPSPKYAVGDGDTTYPVHTILAWGGTLYAINGKGAWQADQFTRFKNQCPQMADWPDPTNGQGAFLGAGFMWIPTIAALYRLKPGESKGRGPELTGRPNYRWRVRNGVYWGGAFYLVCDDLASVGNACVVKMYADEQNLSPDGHDYVYHHWMDLSSTSPGYFIGISPGGTNPKLVVGDGNNAGYVIMNRGGTVTATPSDPNGEWATSANLNTGVMMLSPDMATVSNLVGSELVCKVVNPGESLTLAYSIDDQPYQNFLTTAEGGGTAAIANTVDYESVQRFANPSISEGQQMQFRLTGTLTTTTTRWEVREWWVWGYSHAKMTDVITVIITADAFARPGGLRSGLSHADILRLWRGWTAREIEIEMEDYEQSRRTRFQVTEVLDKEVQAYLGEGGATTVISACQVTLIRVDRAGEYAQ